MKDKNKIVRNVIIGLFMVKLLLYYTAVNVDILKTTSFLISMAIFLSAMYLYRHSGKEKKRYLGFGMFYTIVTIFLFIDTIYYNYFNQLVSVTQIMQIKNISGSEESVKAAVPILSLLLLADIPVIWILISKVKDFHRGKPLEKKRRVALNVLMWLCIFLISVNPLDMKSIKKINSTEAFTAHIKDALDNTVGKLMYNRRSLAQIIEKEGVSEDVLKRVVAEVAEPDDEGKTKYEGIAKGKNLVIIQMESTQNFVLNAEYNGQVITPNLNALLSKDTIYMDHYYTNMGKGNTSDAEFSTITGLYPVIEGASYDLYYENDYIGLPRLFKDLGYFTCSAIGMDREFYNRDTAYSYQGYETFFASDIFDMDEESGMGLTDKSMFRQMANYLSEAEGPFYSFILTLTTHYPYVLDDELVSLELKEEDEGTLFGGYLQSCRYLDEAIGEFIQELKDNGLYEDTVFVMYGDHHGLNCLDDDNYERVSDFIGYSYDYDTMLNVPMIIHVPGSGITETISTVGGQVDTLSTIANLFDLDISDTITLGQDVVNAKEGFVATVAYMLQGSFITDGVLYEIGRDGTFESGRAINLETRESMPIDGLEAYYEKAVALTEMSKYILEHDEAIVRDDKIQILEDLDPDDSNDPDKM